MSKRIRIFAGPNGSGKTTIIKRLNAEIPFGVYINADDIEAALKSGKSLVFNTYQISVTTSQLQNYFKTSTFSPNKRGETDLSEKISVVNNVLFVDTVIDSYLAADIAEFIRQQLVHNGISFTYETVMSHEAKIAFMKHAKKLGYRVYVYYIATEDPKINISRVHVRVSQNGHHVPPETIINRYNKSLALLKSAIQISDRAYLWDNSGDTSVFFAEIENGKSVTLVDENKVPTWFVKNVLQDF